MPPIRKDKSSVEVATNAKATQAQSMYRQALKLHQAGVLDQARRLYEDILKLDSRHFDALHALGVLTLQAGAPRKAAELLSEAITIRPDEAAPYSNRGMAWQTLGQFDAALADQSKAVALKPDFAEAWSNRGMALQALGRLEEALSSYDRAMAIKPGFADAHYNRANALVDMNRRDAAAGNVKPSTAAGSPDGGEGKATRRLPPSTEPATAKAYLQRANALQKQKRYEEAVADYDQAIALKPDYAEAWCNRGRALEKLGRFDAALESHDRALAIRPSYVLAHINRGNVLQALKQFDAMLQSYEQAIALDPRQPLAHANRGVALEMLKRLHEAVASYDRAIALRPGHAQAYINRGNALQKLGRPDAAINDYDQAIALEPQHAEARWNKALALLLNGRLGEGWPLYEWRWKLKDAARLRENQARFPKPLWLGREDIAGKTLLMHSEQGLGDSIQFCRYARLASERGATVILCVPQSLLGLMRGLAGVSRLVAPGQPLPEFDYHCPLLSLPLAFRTDLDSIPRGTRYLQADPEKLRTWSARLGHRSRPRIGLVWSGRPSHRDDENRSLLLADVMRRLPRGPQYVCLQKDVRDIDMPQLQSNKDLLRLNEELQDFTDTAALCELMDLVISVDTSVAHLSAALGKTTCILLPLVPDWRWLLHREDSPWYPSVKLYRQPGVGDWDSPFAKLRADLSRHLADPESNALRPAAPQSSAAPPAAETIPQAVAIAMANPEQQMERALRLHRKGLLQQARSAYVEILETQPRHVHALHLLGVIAHQHKDYTGAAELIGRAIAIRADIAEFHSNLGLTLHRLNRLDDALKSFDRAIALKPDYAEAHANRGITLKELLRLDEAVASYDRAIAIKPDYAQAYVCKALALLLQGQFAQGLQLYEWRRKPGQARDRQFRQPLWLGAEPIAGKTILLHGEQGLGDVIQFCRYAALVADQDARVILEVKQPLAGLLGQLAGPSRVIVKGSALPPFDYHCPLMSLPLAFKTTLDTIPARRKYLSADPDKVRRWADRLGEKNQPRVGLAWSGSSGHVHDHNRSIALAALLPHLPAGCRYVSLQKELRVSDRKTLASRPDILHPGDELQDFADTAGLCELMDVVISVDTSVAHLSGALGVRTWVLLPFSPDWRWLLSREDSPWYTGMRLYRQARIDRWDDVLARISADLALLGD